MEEVNIEKIICYSCTADITEGDEVEHNGNTYCTDCVVECDGCSTTLDSDDSITVGDYNYCTECGRICEHCSEGMASDDSYFISGVQEYWCDSCYTDDSFYCEACSENYSSRYSYFNVEGTTYCESCNDDNNWYCDDCDDYHHNDTACENESSSGSNCCRMGRSGTGIHDYNCKPSPIFKGKDKHGVYLGFELETEYANGISNASAYASTELEGVAYLKHDGSLNNGFEIVTHPHTHLTYREDSAILWNTIEKLRTYYNARSWDTDSCGLHIHISRKGFSSGAHLHRFIALVYHNAPTMMKFAGRKSRFARFNDVYTFDEYDRPVFSLKHKTGSPSHYASERYSAVNTQNKDTIELRFFRGTMNTSGVLSSLDLAQAMVEYTRELRLDDVKLGALSWDWFADYVASNNGLYPDLYSRLDKIQSVDINKPIKADA